MSSVNECAGFLIVQNLITSFGIMACKSFVASKCIEKFSDTKTVRAWHAEPKEKKNRKAIIEVKFDATKFEATRLQYRRS